MRNDEFELLEKIKREYQLDKEIEKKLTDLIDRFKTIRKTNVDRNNEWNKQNKEYHNIVNKLSYARKTNNELLIAKYEQEFDEIRTIMGKNF